VTIRGVLRERRDTEGLHTLVTTPSYLMEKIDRIGVTDVLTDLEDAAASVGFTGSAGDLFRVCCAEAHHFSQSGAPLGVSSAQQLSLRARFLGIDSVADAAQVRLQHASRPWVRRLWSGTRASPDLLRTLVGHIEPVTAVAFAGDQVVTVSTDRLALLWNSVTGELLRRLQCVNAGHHFTCVASEPNGQWAVLGDSGGGLTKWDIRTGAARTIAGSHSDSVVAVAAAGDGAVVSGSAAGTACVWDDSGEVRCSTDVSGAVRALALSGDATLVVIAAEVLTIWDVASGVRTTIEDAGTRITAIAMTADDRVVCGTADGPAQVWALHPLSRLQDFRGAVCDGLALTDDGRYAVFAAADGAHVIDIEADERVQVLYGHGAGVFAVDTRGDLIVTGAEDRTARLWRLVAGGVDDASPQGHRSRITAVAATPGAARVVSVSQDETMKVWDGVSGAVLHTCAPVFGSTPSLVLIDGGRSAVTGSLGSLRIWDVESGRLERDVETPIGRFRCLTQSPDGRWLVLGSAEGDLFGRLDDVWQWHGEGHTDTVNRLAFAPNSTALASASDDHTLRVWNWGTKQCRHIIPHENRVLSVCFSADSEYVITGAEDGYIRLWHIRTGVLKDGSVPGAV
jgi:WD40 repeat protein